METVKRWLGDTAGTDHKQSYHSIRSHGSATEDEPLYRSIIEEGEHEEYNGSHKSFGEEEFSWTYYLVFLLLGVAMLWAWNMFLAAGPYFASRFASSEWISANFQPVELSISNMMNLSCVLFLANIQENANYPKRITVALTVNMVSFALLAVSTKVFTGVTAAGYFTFLLTQVLAAALATGLLQNGLFAYVASFGREEYTQGIMTGQAIAGVSPPLVQIVSILSAPAVNAKGEKADESSDSALAYFLTASAISLATLVIFMAMSARRERTHGHKHIVPDPMSASIASIRRPVSLKRLAKKLRWLALSVALCFIATMMFPVFTQRIHSVRNPETAARLFQPGTYIPLALFFWNAGDLVGRLMTAVPALRLTHRARLVFALAVARIAFIPLYELCNIDGKGAIINSDAFYLIVVQFLFGISNGYVGSTCMMGFVEYVEEEEREAAGGFMGLSLVTGLTIGSLLSFLVA